jgi:hypothetical protein
MRYVKNFICGLMQSRLLSWTVCLRIKVAYYVFQRRLISNVTKAGIKRYDMNVTVWSVVDRYRGSGGTSGTIQQATYT